ncbi:hypothetical protein [Kocuria sp.]|uniref:hypothetical protein n=1 Tax=Kocuria sp. TaxID=1871328 RepID=UPI0026DD1938|nr:hypothetical protein [Kocuria sp.]MDO4919091.1 hypothetical protein [Kocuria sp.]
MEPAPINRRTLAKGAVWSVPVVAMASAAPAVAASAAPELRPSGRFSYNQGWGSTQTDNSTAYKVFSTASGGTTPASGFCILNTNTSMSISNAAVTYYFPLSNLTFSTEGGPGANGWSLMTRDTTKSTKSYNGVTYYPYTSRYTAAVTARTSTTCFPVYGFQSSSTSTRASYIYVDHSVVVDGQTLTANFGPLQFNT